MIKKLEEVEDSRNYKLIVRLHKIGCRICGLHTGCNAIAKDEQRSQKKFRKTQYKSLKIKNHE